MRLKMNAWTKIFAIALIIFLVPGCMPLDDIAFSRQVLTLLIDGRYAARTMIDWPNFRVLGQDAGKPYLALKKDQAKIAYERAFIDGFAKGFQEKGQGVGIKTFYNWRYYKTVASKISIVVANCRNENVLFLFYVRPAVWGKKLVGINVLIGKEPVRDIPEAFEDVNYFPSMKQAEQQAIEQRVVQENLATDEAQRIQEQREAVAVNSEL